MEVGIVQSVTLNTIKLSKRLWDKMFGTRIFVAGRLTKQIRNQITLGEQ